MISPNVVGPSAIVGLLAGVVGLVMILGLVGLFVVVVVANRAEPDATGRRPFAVYLYSVSFVTLWTALIGSIAIVSSLIELIGSHPQPFIGSAVRMSLHPIGDAAARGSVLGALILFASLAVFYVHLQKGRELVDTGTPATSPSRRVAQSYVAAVSFVSVLLVVFSLVVALYAVFQILGPGVFGGAGRIPVLRHLLDACYVALASGVILWYHLTLADPPLWPRRREAPVAAQTAASE